jgi:ATP-dependent Clp protease ATP-binding subunit ClpC
MHPEKFLEHFSHHLKNAIARGISFAGSVGSATVTPVHLLYALCEEEGSLSAGVLRSSGMNAKALLAFVSIASAPEKKSNAPLPELNPAARRALEKAMFAAYERSESHVGTEHLLFGILMEEYKDTDAAIRAAGADPDKLFHALTDLMENADADESMADLRDRIEEFQKLNHTAEHPAHEHAQKPERHPTALDVFTVDLTDKRVESAVDPVIGREKEIERIIRILCRRTKNNPVLVGEPGVGKTAIVEGLAKKIAHHDVPAALKGKKILSLDLPLLVAGTMYRGEFEARLKQLVEEISRRDDCILFIDEIHTIIGAGANQGAMDAANILKPALARGELRCIGATTVDEYQKHIAEDPALERRFQEIRVEEPTPEETVQILHGVKKYYETFHDVAIDDDAVAAAVDLSVRYIHDNFLPDKAIDLLDEAGAALALTRPAPRRAPAAGKTKQSKRATPSAPLLHVTPDAIARVLAGKLPMPPEWLLMNQWEHLDRVEHELREHIVGQDDALAGLMRALRQAHLGIGAANKPFSSLLFAGPTGVGKTALAKALAHSLYRDEKALIKLDMTEFSEGHSVSKLMGSPAGYIGYKERNHFLDELKKRPYAILLFDEFDKAHPDVQKILFQILDEGTLRTAQGKQISFRHTIVILTANVGEELYASPGIGFGRGDAGAVQSAITAKIKDQFGAALVGRIGETLLFRPLTTEHLSAIAAKAFHAAAVRLYDAHHITLVPDDLAIAAMLSRADKPSDGARNVERLAADILQQMAMSALQTPKKKKRYTVTHRSGAFNLS